MFCLPYLAAKSERVVGKLDKVLHKWQRLVVRVVNEKDILTGNMIQKHPGEIILVQILTGRYPLEEDRLHLNILLETVQLLAAPYEQQVASFPAFVHIPDEIALLFDDAWIMYADELSEKGLITLAQRKAFEQMDEALDQMSQIQDVWTLSSLESSLEWANVRHLARDILASFHEPKKAPQLFWVQYVDPQFTGASESSEEGE